MRILMPEIDSYVCGKELDDDTLVEQFEQAKIILEILLDRRKGNKDHPAIKQWKHNTGYLYQRLNGLLHSLTIRNHLKPTVNSLGGIDRIQKSLLYPFPKPFWLHASNSECSNIVRSHRSFLIRKNPDYYSQFNWDVSPYWPLYWPRQRDGER